MVSGVVRGRGGGRVDLRVGHTHDRIVARLDKLENECMNNESDKCSTSYDRQRLIKTCYKLKFCSSYEGVLTMATASCSSGVHAWIPVMQPLRYTDNSPTFT